MDGEAENIRIDALTNFFLPAQARKHMQRYCQDTQTVGNDTVFLVHIENWEQLCTLYDKKNANLLLAKFSFLLTKIFHKTDMYVRVGSATFFVYAMGNYKQADIERKLLQAKHDFEHNQKVTLKLSLGAVYVYEKYDFDTLLHKVEKALANAIENKQFFSMDEQRTTALPFIPYPHVVPAYELDSTDADMKFISDMTDFLFGCMDLNFGIEMILSRMCKYFGVQQIYVMEKDYDEGGFSITHDWVCESIFIENDNLKKMPLLIGEAYQHAFDRRNLVICNQLADLFKFDTFIALREKIRGAKALMQCKLFDKGNYIGYICVNDLKQERVWTAEEIATFVTLVKIINTSILQLRSQQFHQLSENHDALTNSWNLHKFQETVSEYLDKDDNKAFITLDIKNFKFINAEYGYSYGSRILKAIAQILKSFISKDEYYARMDADLFVIQLNYQTLDELKQRMDSLIQKIERCTLTLEKEAQIICMIGIYLLNHKQRNFEEIIDCANTARKSIKDAHASGYAFFNNEIEEVNIKEHYYTQIMKQALKDEEFVVYYQPKINIHTRRCTSLEALVRWKREGTLIPPNEFISLFERNHFILELDLYVLEKVCKQLRYWMDHGQEPLPVSVNISRVHLEYENVVHQITAICSKYAIPYYLIELEITESAFLSNEACVIEKALEMKKEGFILSMDDFGTGFSSLNLLKDIPVDILKLDCAFFQKHISEREKIILTNIVHMAQQLQVTVVSEGIETESQVQLLKEIGCDIAQGFYYSRPYPIEVLEPVLWNPFHGGQS